MDKRALLLIGGLAVVAGAVPVAQAADSNVVTLRIARPVGGGDTPPAQVATSNVVTLHIARPITSARQISSPELILKIARPEVIPGDLDGDGRVDASEVDTLLKIYLGLQDPTPRDLAAGDTRPKPGTGGRPYGDGRILADDLNWLFRRFLGLEKTP